MKMSEKDFKELMTVIEEYNAKISESFTDYYYLLAYVTTGTEHVIMFGETVIWNSEGTFGERKYNENTDKYETFRSLIKRKMNEQFEFHKKINKIINRK
jgi:hypothetical protein